MHCQYAFLCAELKNLGAEQLSERGPDRKVNVHLTSSTIWYVGWVYVRVQLLGLYKQKRLTNTGLTNMTVIWLSCFRQASRHEYKWWYAK